MITNYLKISYLVLLIAFLILLRGFNIYSVFLLILFIASIVIDKHIETYGSIDPTLTNKDLLYILKSIIVCSLVIFIALVLSGFEAIILCLYGLSILVFYYVLRELELRLVNKI